MPLYQSEVVENNLDPVWKPFKLDSSACGMCVTLLYVINNIKYAMFLKLDTAELDILVTF